MLCNIHFREPNVEKRQTLYVCTDTRLSLAKDRICKSFKSYVFTLN